MSNLNPQQFAHYAWEQDKYSDPRQAAYSCHASTSAFLGREPEAERWEFVGLTDKSMVPPTGVEGHEVGVLHGHVVDWTARQFNPNADHPHIEPLATYRTRWQEARKLDREDW